MKYSINKLNHFAWKCRDAEETRHFYEDVLGLPLAHVITSDHVPSTGEYAPYIHIFFEMKDGSYIAFFDIGDGKVGSMDPDTPDWLTHFAFEVGSLDELHAAKKHLESHGIDVIGPTDHKILQSIYFFDPNGFRLEFTTWTVDQDYMAKSAKSAHAMLKDSIKKMKAAHAREPVPVK
jgi:glyoxylase I family protein